MIIVDELRSGKHPFTHKNRQRFQWCFMKSDESTSELKAMAVCIGVTDDWFCAIRYNTHNGGYYILNEGQRLKAIENGAIAVLSQELSTLVRTPHSPFGEKLKDKYINNVDVDRECSKNKPFFKPNFADNEYILEWWQPEHDEMLKECIVEKQWLWHYEVHKDILHLTPQNTIQEWRASDPLCQTYAWYNILRCFAAARADKLGFAIYLKPPDRNVCILCQKSFSEASVSLTYIKMLGVDQINVCNPCMDDCMHPSLRPTVDKEFVIEYIQELAEALQGIPPADYGSRRKFKLIGIEPNQRARILKVICRRPDLRLVNSMFPSWLSALIAAGVLEDGARKRAEERIALPKMDTSVCPSVKRLLMTFFIAMASYTIKNHHIQRATIGQISRSTALTLST